MLKNYHTHTYRCKHASGDVDDYCDTALARGLKVLGFTDHTPFPDDRWLFRRMEFSSLEGYLNAVDSARQKYKGQLIVLKGMECDYMSEYETFYREELLGRYQCDYIVGSIHWLRTRDGWTEVPDGKWSARDLKAYCDEYIAAMGFSEFLFMAHPDIFGVFYPAWDSEMESCSRAILECAQEKNIVLEINSNGLRKSKIQTPNGLWTKYPIIQFWELAAQYDVRVVVNSDAHKPADITEGLPECYEIVDRFGLQLADFSALEIERG